MFCECLFSILSKLYTTYKLYNFATIQTFMFFCQYNIAKNMYQQKYSNLKSKIVENINSNNIRNKEEMRKKNLNKIYDIIYISDNKEEELIQLYATIIYINFTNVFLNLSITNKY